MYYFAFVLVSIGLSACGATLLMTAVVNWFRRRLTLAMGIVATGFAVGGLLVPVISAMVDGIGWRDTMFWLGIGMFAIVIPLSTLMRHKPEQYGMLPDGEVQFSAGKNVANIESSENDFTPGQAFKTWGFWAISLAALLQALVQNAVMVHIMPYLTTVGFARAMSSLVASAIPLASIAGRLGIGFVGDRFNKKWTLVVGFGLVSLGTLSLSYADSGTWLVVIFFILFGIGWGSTVTVRSLLVRDYFGKSRYGSIFGIYMGILCIGAIIGPPISGWAYDTYGSYKETWLIYVALTVVSSIIMATATKAKKVGVKIPAKAT
jgi:MFS family permease